jgi:hypothetical protein
VASNKSSGASSVTTSLSFIGPTTLFTAVAPNQRIHVVGTATLGSTAVGGGTALDLYVCFQRTGSPITTEGGGAFGLTVAQNQRSTFSLSSVVTVTGPTADTVVGLCGSSVSAGNWNNNEWGYVSALLLN